MGVLERLGIRAENLLGAALNNLPPHIIDPTIVPKKSYFYEHDDRGEDDDWGDFRGRRGRGFRCGRGMNRGFRGGRFDNRGGEGMGNEDEGFNRDFGRGRGRGDYNNSFGGYQPSRVPSRDKWQHDMFEKEEQEAEGGEGEEGTNGDAVDQPLEG